MIADDLKRSHCLPPNIIYAEDQQDVYFWNNERAVIFT